MPVGLVAVLVLALGACEPASRGGASDGGSDVAVAEDAASADGAPRRGAPPDMASPLSPDGSTYSGPPPITGPIGPLGGAVDLLHFGVVGDTRPPACEDTAHYPTAIINAVADQFKARGVEFAVDLGDHMYVCNDDLTIATAQMNLYMSAVRRFGQQWYMTQGNHECWKGPCVPGSANANHVAFLRALGRPLLYYTFDISTTPGLVTFVFIADNSWDATQSAWLEQTLTKADTRARYTIVLRHHPEGDTTVATNPKSVRILRNHKFALFLTGHEHLYKHMSTDGGRDVVIGNGGAPLIAGGAFNGYAIVDQQQDGRLVMKVYDVASGFAPVDTVTLMPN